MSQKYKIFINDKVLYLIDNPAKVEDILTSSTPYIIQPFKNDKNLIKLLDILLGNLNSSNMVIYHPKVDEVLTALKAQFTYMEAAGGLVQNHFGDILLIHRLGFWDLPKGKIDEGETTEIAAKREVREETGLLYLQLEELIQMSGLLNTCTYHSYELKGKQILKATYWYKMTTEDQHELIPQLSENIEKAVWLPRNEIPKLFPEMYPSIVDILKAVGIQ
jgi:8-oxo-dGTP pyrophosphatase MutT (NUDIX family)